MDLVSVYKMADGKTVHNKTKKNYNTDLLLLSIEKKTAERNTYSKKLIVL